MPVVVENLESVDAGAELYPKRKRWTRRELSELIREGHTEFERYELFDGELIDKMGKNRPHVRCVSRLVAELRRLFGEEFVEQEAPINLRPVDDEFYRPEPDAMVLNRPSSEFENVDPGPEHIVLAVEIADSTLRFDLSLKARAYARAGIPEYWVVDVTGKRVIVHRQTIEGRYTLVQAYRLGEAITPVSLQGASIAVDSMFAR
jgi:Uma2 family endonuclease